MNLQERIESVKASGVSNCRGTALYVVGIIQEDLAIGPINIEKFMENLERSDDNPNVGDLVVFRTREEGYNMHMGVIILRSPKVKIFHRERANGVVRVDDLLEYHEKHYPDAYLEYFRMSL